MLSRKERPDADSGVFDHGLTICGLEPENETIDRTQRTTQGIFIRFSCPLFVVFREISRIIRLFCVCGNSQVGS